jgi:molybdopterin converting factor small subunit
MAVVHLPHDLAADAGGVSALQVDVPRVRELLEVLVARFPALAGRVERMAVAIDGEIYQDAEYRRLAPSSEVHLVPPVAGG